METVWEVWDTAIAETESAIGNAIDIAIAKYGNNPATDAEIDDFNSAVSDAFRLKEGSTLLNSVDLDWMEADDIARYQNDPGAYLESYTECLPDLHLARPGECGPGCPALREQRYEFRKLPVGALLAFVAADFRVSDKMTTYDEVIAAILREAATRHLRIYQIGAEPDDHMSWQQLAGLLENSVCKDAPHIAAILKAAGAEGYENNADTA